MFVVRLKFTDREQDLKAFTERAGALTRFRAARLRIIEGDIEEAAVFEVVAEQPKAAIELLALGKASLLEIYPEPKTREQAEQWLAKIGL